MMSAGLEAAARRHQTLEQVTLWALDNGGELAMVVTQDEFTHDIVFAFGETWLVFDTT